MAPITEAHKQQLLVYTSFCSDFNPVLIPLDKFMLKVIQLDHSQAKHMAEHLLLGVFIMRDLQDHPFLKIFDVGNDNYPYVGLSTTTKEQVAAAM
jgi:hypothetical protein